MTAFVWIALTNAIQVQAADKPAKKPNIIFILADDLGYGDLGCYGSKIHETPNLDRLALQGMRFTQAYAACSVCSPTRASILSGKYPARLDLTIWLNGSSGNRRKLLDAPFAKFLPLKEVTIAEALKKAGYATASIGKWHLGPKPYYPEHQGFDLNIAGTHNGSPAGGYYLPNKMKLPGAKKGDYLTDRLTDEAIKFIETNRDKPFFLYQSYHSVHTPIQGKPSLVAHYKKKQQASGGKYNTAYAAMVHSLDENVGRIMARLDDLKLTDRTVVFFFSDNGGFQRFASNAPLRAGKGYSYEGGHREPLIVRYPPMVKAGTLCDVPVISTDFYPTILELAGLETMPKQHVDGISIAGLLKDHRAALEKRDLFWHYPHYSPQGGTPSGAILSGDYKLLEFFEDGHLELYNLKVDIGEKNNLAQSMPERTKELHGRLIEWRKRVDAKMPRANPRFKPKKSKSALKNKKL